MSLQDEKQFIADLLRYRTLPVRNFFNGSPINSWAGGSTKRNEIRRWGGEFFRLFGDIHNQLTQRQNLLNAITTGQPGAPAYNEADGLVFLNTIIKKLDQFHEQELSNAPGYVRRNRATGYLWSSSQNLAEVLEAKRLELRTRLIHSARNEEETRLNEIKQIIDAYMGTPLRANASAAVWQAHNDYKAFLARQARSIESRLNKINSSAYNAKDGHNFLVDLQKEFMQRDREMHKQMQANQKFIHRVTNRNRAQVLPYIEQWQFLSDINRDIHNPLSNKINNLKTHLLPISSALTADAKQNSNIRKSFRIANRETTRNWREFAWGVGTGIVIKTAFTLAAASFASPLAIAIGAGMATGMARRVIKRARHGHKLEKGWWWKSAIAGGLGGAVGNGLGELFFHHIPWDRVSTGLGLNTWHWPQLHLPSVRWPHLPSWANGGGGSGGSGTGVGGGESWGDWWQRLTHGHSGWRPGDGLTGNGMTAHCRPFACLGHPAAPGGLGHTLSGGGGATTPVNYTPSSQPHVFSRMAPDASAFSGSGVSGGPTYLIMPNYASYGGWYYGGGPVWIGGHGPRVVYHFGNFGPRHWNGGGNWGGGNWAHHMGGPSRGGGAVRMASAGFGHRVG